MTSGVSREMIEITTADGVAEAYVSRPDGGEHPGVLFYVDAIGLRPRTKEMADRIASWGYTVMAPHFFYRDGTAAELEPAGDLRQPGEREAFFSVAMPRVGAYSTDRSDPDLEAFLETLQQLPGVIGRDIGVTGYCMGGRLSLRAASLHPDEVAAAGAFHAAALVTDEQDSVHRLIGNARAEIVAGHADNDGSNTADNVADLEAAMSAAGLTYRSEIYAGAAHGYSMSDTSVYDAAATERHFRELEGLFARTLAT